MTTNACLAYITCTNFFVELERVTTLYLSRNMRAVKVHTWENGNTLIHLAVNHVRLVLFNR